MRQSGNLGSQDLPCPAPPGTSPGGNPHLRWTGLTDLGWLPSWDLSEPQGWVATQGGTDFGQSLKHLDRAVTEEGLLPRLSSCAGPWGPIPMRASKTCSATSGAPAVQAGRSLGPGAP